MTIDEIDVELKEVALGLVALKKRSMEYQASYKEELAVDLGFSRTVFFNLPYSQWRDVSKWGYTYESDDV